MLNLFSSIERSLGAALIAALSIVCWADAAAAPVSGVQAETAVRSWLVGGRQPMHEVLGSQVSGVTLYTGLSHQSQYYVVDLAPTGFVVVPADDRIEPILCFGSSGHFVPTQGDPLADMIDMTIYGRLTAVSNRDVALSVSSNRIRSKWQFLLGQRNGLGSTADATSIKNSPGPSDIEVAPMIQSQWNQLQSNFGNCYNYWTPNNTYCGCVATDLGQLMRFYQYPTSGVGTGSFPCKVNGANVTLSLRGGNGRGGAYVWSEMPLTPDLITTNSPTLKTEYQEIGDILYDAGVATNMAYAPTESLTGLGNAQAAWTSTFGFGQADYTYFANFATDQQLISIINPDLDAGLPVIAGLYDTNNNSGHASLIDGYGYDSGTLYHHINVG